MLAALVTLSTGISVVLDLASGGKSEGMNANAQQGAGETAVRTVTKDDLEKIRIAVVRYFEDKKPEFWRAFVEELRRGAIHFGKDFVGIGVWKYEITEQGAALVRQPPVSSEMHYFGANLVTRNNAWAVTGHFHEKEILDLRE
jgi:hypothetical protein